MRKTSDQAHSGGPRVFLSYAHDDEIHARAVLDLANFLTARGIDVEVEDWHSSARRDRYAWILQEIQAADFVIVVASPGYRSVGDGTNGRNLHLGVQAQAAVLRDLLYGDRETWFGRVLPVLLPGRSLDELPKFTQPYSASHFVIDSISDDGVEALLRVLTKQPRHKRPALGPIPDLGTSPRTNSTTSQTEPANTKVAVAAVTRVAHSFWSQRPDRRTTLIVTMCAVPGTALLFIPGFPWFGAFLAGIVALAVSIVVRGYPRGRGTKAWKIVTLMVSALIAGGSAALPGAWTPVLLGTADDPAGAYDDSSSPESSVPRDPTQTALPGASTAAEGIRGDHSGTTPGREPSEEEFRRADGSRPPTTSGPAPTSSKPAQRGSVDIQSVGHSFMPGIDRITVIVRNTRPDPVLVTQIDIYMSDWGGGHEWADPGEWHFSTSGQMYAGNPAYDGTVRTHGFITLDGDEFSEPLVGQGYIDEEKKSWRRLLTFNPQKFLAAAATVSIVIDLPTTHLLQMTSQNQPAGPVVEYTLDPEKGSLFTRVDLRTPEDSSFACNHLRRPPDQPVCDTVDPLASVQLPQ